MTDWQDEGRVLSSAAVATTTAVAGGAAGAPTDTDAEETRQKYIGHEASVKSIGLLYFIGAGLMGVLSVVLIRAVPIAPNQNGGGADFAKALGVGLLAVAALLTWTAFGLRQLRSWARGVSVLLSVIGLAGFPVGTVINGYILYLLVSEKSTTVFSEQYKRVIEATPGIQSRTSIVVWFLVALLAILLGLVLIAALAGVT